MFEIAVVLVLVALNGLFALSELAVVSARRSRLRTLAQEGRKGANRALALAADPSRFLSTAQIGITAVGLVAGAYSGATLSADFTRILIESGVPDGLADWLAYIGVFSAITYLSLIIGELVPKNLALRHAESIACAVAPLMTTLARIAAPAVDAFAPARWRRRRGHGKYWRPYCWVSRSMFELTSEMRPSSAIEPTRWMPLNNCVMRKCQWL